MVCFDCVLLVHLRAHNLLPRSVGSRFLDLNGERKEVHEWNANGTRDDRYYGLRWGCTYGITSQPCRWSAQSIGRYVYVGVGIPCSAKVPRSSRAELNVDRELRTSGHTEYGTTWLVRLKRYITRDALGNAAKNYLCRRSVGCKQGIGCWNMPTVGAWRWTVGWQI
jgi:hypothetical protein